MNLSIWYNIAIYQTPNQINRRYNVQASNSYCGDDLNGTIVELMNYRDRRVDVELLHILLSLSLNM